MSKNKTEELNSLTLKNIENINTNYIKNKNDEYINYIKLIDNFFDIIDRYFLNINNKIYNKDLMDQNLNTICINGSKNYEKEKFVRDLEKYSFKNKLNFKIVSLNLSNYILCNNIIDKFVKDLIYETYDLDNSNYKSFKKNEKNILDILFSFKKIPLKGIIHPSINDIDDSFSERQTLKKQINHFLNTANKNIINKKIIFVITGIEKISENKILKFLAIFENIIFKIKKIFFIIPLNKDLLEEKMIKNKLISNGISISNLFDRIINIDTVLCRTKEIEKELNKSENIMIKLIDNKLNLSEYNIKKILNKMILFNKHNKLNFTINKRSDILFNGIIFYLLYLKQYSSKTYENLILDLKNKNYLDFQNIQNDEIIPNWIKFIFKNKIDNNIKFLYDIFFELNEKYNFDLNIEYSNNINNISNYILKTILY